MENRGRLRNYEKANIIELYLYHKKTMVEIREITGFSVQTISNTISLYFKKPKSDRILRSKV